MGEDDDEGETPHLNPLLQDEILRMNPTRGEEVLTIIMH
jgi:hypothetical protein